MSGAEELYRNIVLGNNRLTGEWIDRLVLELALHWKWLTFWLPFLMEHQCDRHAIRRGSEMPLSPGVGREPWNEPMDWDFFREQSFYRDIAYWPKIGSECNIAPRSDFGVRTEAPLFSLRGGKISVIKTFPFNLVINVAIYFIFYTFFMLVFSMYMNVKF